ncbi:MAG: type II secretion system F family protein [Actinomycetota bacterium]
MPIVVWLASASIAASVPLAWWAIMSDRTASSRAGRNLLGDGPTLRHTVLERSLVERMALPVARRVGAVLVRFTPIGWVEGRNRALARGGLSGRITAEQVLGAKLLLPALAAVILSLQLVGDTQPRAVALMAACVLAAFFAPDLAIRAVADRRAEAMVGALPDMLDQITISVEAGLGFEAALARTAEGQGDPLAQELLRMLQDVRLGASRADALSALAERAQVDDVRTVVLSLRQSDALGVPLARTLRTVANEMREKRRFRAEERAHRLPTVMIFPLGLCILPALFIVILGPAMLSGFSFG